MDPDFQYLELLFGDWLEYKTGVTYAPTRCGGEGMSYRKHLRARPELAGNIIFNNPSVYPGKPSAQTPTDAVSPAMLRAMPLAGAAMAEIGLDSLVGRNVLRIDRAADDPRFKENASMHQFSYTVDPYPDTVSVDYIAFDRKQPGMRQAIDRIAADEGFQRYIADGKKLAHTHPFTGAPLVPQRAAQQDADYIRAMREHMQRWFQRALTEGSQPRVVEHFGRAFLASYGLRAHVPEAAESTNPGGDGLIPSHIRMLQWLEAWVEYRTGVRVNYLPDGTRCRPKAWGDTTSPYWGKLAIAINLSYPDMPFEAGVAGYADPEPFQSPQAAEKIIAIGAALRELGIGFEPQQMRLDLSTQGIRVGFNDTVLDTSKPLADIYSEIPCHACVITPNAEQLSAVADRLIANEEFRHWCEAKQLTQPAHPYTQHAIDPEASARSVIAEMEETAEIIAQKMANAQYHDYLPMLQRELKQRAIEAPRRV